jgi:hypothetical protein
MNMKAFAIGVGALAICLFAARIEPAKAAEKQPVVVVTGKTIVAFFPPATNAELEKDPDTNESLADFQHYAEAAREPLRKAGIQFHELYAHSFRLRVRQTVSTFRPVKIDVGYYFIAPGRKPHIEYGVMTNTDLMQMANEYFGSSKK